MWIIKWEIHNKWYLAEKSLQQAFFSDMKQRLFAFMLQQELLESYFPGTQKVDQSMKPQQLYLFQIVLVMSFCFTMFYPCILYNIFY